MSDNSSFQSEDKIKSNISYWYLFKKMWPYLRQNKFLFFTSISAVLLLALSSRLLPEVFGGVIDNGFQKNNISYVFIGATIYLLLKVFHSFLQFLHSYLFQKLGNRVLYLLRADLVSHTQKLPMTFFQKNPTGRIVTRLSNDVSQVSELFNDGIVTVFTEVVVFISIVIFMLRISVPWTLLTMVFTPLFLFISIKISNMIRITQRDSKKKLSELNSFVAENLNGIKVIQLYLRTKKSKDKFLVLSNDYASLSFKSTQQYAFLMPVVNLFTGLTIASALYLAGRASLMEQMAVGSMVAFILHSQDFIQPLREILEKYQQFQNSLTSAERIFQLFDELEEPMQQGQSYQKIQEKIHFKNLTFQYSPELPVVLKNLNFDIPVGSSLAVIGKTGSGKSTLISLLMRFYPFSPNSIFIDNVPIENILIQDLRRHIGLVQQDPFLFKGRLIDNVTLGDKNISDHAAFEALNKIGFFAKTNNVLDKHNTTNFDQNFMVEEKGANLSTGEKQLIAFARVLVFNPDILILDEATANVDSSTELIIQSATEEIIKGRTSIIIAHRLSTISKCHQILVLDHGQMLEKGSPQELIQQKGAYYQLLNTTNNTAVVI